MELELKGICKSFGAGDVLDNVDFRIGEGEICALLGENGAGKSTLMNIVGGVYQPDRGGIFIDGKKVTFSSPYESLKTGIAFIHQELNLVNDLTVYENMFLFGFPKKGLLLDKKKMIEKTREVFSQIGVELDPCALVETLDASYKQTVEIARALMSDSSLIIMDEPTASLTNAEIDRVFGIMRSLKKKGISMIFISHKLNEVMEICDRYAVLRNGVFVNCGRIEDTTVKSLASSMVGHEIVTGTAHAPTVCGSEIMRLENLTDGKHFFDISLSVKKGEILGVTGLLGDGRSELFGSVFGIYKGWSGKVVLDGKLIHPSAPYKAIDRGLAYLPKNRKENAIIADMSIIDNGTVTTIHRFRRGLFIDRKGQKNVFEKQVEDLHIQMSDGEMPITTLSGGNQQKVVLAKWLISSPKVLILDNPTQGVDVGAKEEIYSAIASLSERGIAVIVLSSEASEIIRLCSRSIVMYHGRIAGELSGSEMTERSIMYLATGVGKDSKEK